jgi:hypothetical protein
MDIIRERLAKCDRELRFGTEEHRGPHTEDERACLLRCERDRLIEREKLVVQLVMQAAA